MARYRTAESSEVARGLLGETPAGDLIHIELRSPNDDSMASRMLEYCAGIFRLRGRFPRQVLLYVGGPPLRTQSELRGPGLTFAFHPIDIRSFDGERLIESPHLGDNVIAILARLRDHRQAIRRVIEKIAGLTAGEQASVIEQLLILAGLRNPAT